MANQHGDVKTATCDLGLGVASSQARRFTSIYNESMAIWMEKWWLLGWWLTSSARKMGEQWESVDDQRMNNGRITQVMAISTGQTMSHWILGVPESMTHLDLWKNHTAPRQQLKIRYPRKFSLCYSINIENNTNKDLSEKWVWSIYYQISYSSKLLIHRKNQDDHHFP